MINKFINDSERETIDWFTRLTSRDLKLMCKAAETLERLKESGMMSQVIFYYIREKDGLYVTFKRELEEADYWHFRRHNLSYEKLISRSGYVYEIYCADLDCRFEFDFELTIRRREDVENVTDH